MRLFKREKSTSSPCPRCRQLVAADGLVCPMCGWDLRDAYQGPALSPDPADGGQDTGAEDQLA